MWYKGEDDDRHAHLASARQAGLISSIKATHRMRIEDWVAAKSHDWTIADSWISVGMD